MNLRNITAYGILFSMFYTIGYGNPMLVRIVAVSDEEIICPLDGYFDLGDLFHYDRKGETPEQRLTQKPYLKYEKDPRERLPIFYKSVRADGKSEQSFSLLYTKRWRNQLARLNKADPGLADNSWSLSTSHSSLYLESFDTSPYPFAVDREHFLDKEYNKIPPSLQNLPEVWKKFEMVDLTHSRLVDINYDFLAKLPSLKMLALTYQGGDLNNPSFSANTNVKNLVIWNTTLSKHAFAKLAEFSALKNVTFNGCDLSYIVEGQEDLRRISQFTNKMESLRMVNCGRQLYEMLNLCEWGALKKVEFDFMPISQGIIGDRRFDENVLDSLTLVVSSKSTALFKTSRTYRRLVDFEENMKILLIENL